MAHCLQVVGLNFQKINRCQTLVQGYRLETIKFNLIAIYEEDTFQRYFFCSANSVPVNAKVGKRNHLQNYEKLKVEFNAQLVEIPQERKYDPRYKENCSPKLHR